MAFTHSLLLCVLVTLAFAVPQPALDARQDSVTSSTTATDCVADPTSSAVVACVSAAGISSVCSGITSVEFVYSTVVAPRTTTRRSTVATSFTSTQTRVASRTTTVRRTSTFTSTVRITSGTTRSLAGTLTSEITSTTTQYTCPYSQSSITFPTPSPTEDSPDLLRRQTNAAPTCLARYRTAFGSDAIVQACRCIDPSISIPTVTITEVLTSTSGVTTVTQLRTATTRTTTRTTTIITATSLASSNVETTITVPVTVPYISTIRTTSIATVTTAYPLPTGRFRLFITIEGQKLYGRNVRVTSNNPGTDVIALSPASSSESAPENASSFGFNNLMNLILSAAQTKIAVEQSTYEVPFVYLVPEGLPVPDPWTAPAFAPCNDTLIPGGAQSNHVFAACFAGNSAERRLAFGSPGTWSGRPDRVDDAARALSNGTCITGVVGIEAISGSLTPSQTSETEASSTETSDTAPTEEVDPSATTELVESPTTTPPPDTTSLPANSSASPTNEESLTLPTEAVTEQIVEPTSPLPPSPPLARAPESY